MRSRSALLPDTGDPYVSLLWLDMYEKRWGDEVDHLYFALYSPVEKAIVDALHEAVVKLPHTSFIYHPSLKDHGMVIKEVLPQITQKYVMLIENDGIIFRQNVVDECFRWLEKGDYEIVGSGRGSASLTLCEASKKFFGMEHIQHSDYYPHFWPNFFFTDVERLRRTNQHFWAKSWEPGEYIKEINWYAEPDEGANMINSDTFVWASLQMMTEKPRVRYVNQYHASPDDLQQVKDRQHLWDGNAGWLHYGSVSTGMMQMLQDHRNVPLAYRTKENWQAFVTDLSFIDVHAGYDEYQRRVAWWKLCYLTQKDKLAHIDGLNDDYESALEKLIDLYGFKRALIDTRVALYRNLLNV